MLKFVVPEQTVVQAFLWPSGQKMGGQSTRDMRKNIKSFSRFFRRVFEFGKIQKVFSALVISSMLSIAIVPNSITDVQTTIDKNFSHVAEAQIEIKTEKSIRLPLAVFAISQGYHFFHPGLDLAAQTGAATYPVMDGAVEKVERGRWAYGNYVTVNHGGGIHSLYAHLSRINVKEGQKVTKNEVLGLIGSTGWSTGPHLHLQIWEEGKLVNPRAFFEGYFGKRMASTL